MSVFFLVIMYLCVSYLTIMDFSKFYFSFAFVFVFTFYIKISSL
jgi:hypothetical protein